MAPSGDTLMCRVHLCNRKAVPNSNLCDGHYRQLVDRALTRKRSDPIPADEMRIVQDGTR